MRPCRAAIRGASEQLRLTSPSYWNFQRTRSWRLYSTTLLVSPQTDEVNNVDVRVGSSGRISLK